MKKRLAIVGLITAALVAGVLLAGRLGIPPFHSVWLRLHGKATVADRVAEFGPAARTRLQPRFEQAGAAYPPARFILAAFKAEKRLDLIAVDEQHVMTFIASYPILAASGTTGPKLRRGDHQVPEGSYRIDSLNPNSAFHLALRVDYPNADDLARCAQRGIADPGGDIMIHGKSASDGCLAMGDSAVEELFVLAADAGWEGAEVVLCPYDFRTAAASGQAAEWGELYAKVAQVLGRLPRGPATPPR